MKFWPCNALKKVEDELDNFILWEHDWKKMPPREIDLCYLFLYPN